MRIVGDKCDERPIYRCRSLIGSWLFVRDSSPVMFGSWMAGVSCEPSNV